MSVDSIQFPNPDAAASSGCPAHVPADQFRHFSYVHDVLNAPTPFDGYLKLRGEKPFWSDDSGGFWVLTSAESIRDCFQDAGTFSNRNIGLGYTAYSRTMIPEQLDPPEHTKYRRLLSPFFTPAAARRLEADTREIARGEIEKFADRGQCDFVEDFAGRFPQIVFLKHVLNFPIEEMETFLSWEHDMMRHPREEAAATRSAQVLWDYLEQVINERERQPIDDDLISELLRGELDGRRVTKDEILDMTFLLFMAGLDTVTSALTLSFYYLAQRPDLRDRIVNNPGDIPVAVEEMLRYVSFVSSIRTANRDIDFHGAPIRAGDRILPPSVLAARDPAEFDEPDEIDFDRSVKRHMAFGAGVHRCLGSHLARVELHVAFDEIHKRMPDYHLQPGASVPFHAAGTLGADHLPLRWTPLTPTAQQEGSVR